MVGVIMIVYLCAYVSVKEWNKEWNFFKVVEEHTDRWTQNVGREKDPLSFADIYLTISCFSSCFLRNINHKKTMQSFVSLPFFFQNLVNSLKISPIPLFSISLCAGESCPLDYLPFSKPFLEPFRKFVYFRATIGNEYVCQWNQRPRCSGQVKPIYC